MSIDDGMKAWVTAPALRMRHRRGRKTIETMLKMFDVDLPAVLQ